MRMWLLRARTRLRNAGKGVGGWLVGHLAIALLRLVRHFNWIKTADFFGAVARRLGPLLPEHEIGRANLAAAFPEKSPAEIETILAGAWENLGRVGAEFAHLDRVWDFDLAHRDKPTRIEATPRSEQLIETLRHDGKPALIFAAHLGNWELPAVAAVALGLDTAVLFRRPNIASADRIVQDLRAVKMGTMIAAGSGAPIRLAQALEQGKHVAMLVDQHFSRGVDVTFFGRPAKANPLLARLLRQIECPLHGVRIVRLPGHRFSAEMTEEIVPARDADGRIDVQGTMQAVTSVIEGWIRETPEQWLWLHRRWR